MIIHSDGDPQVFQVLDWKLYSSDHKWIPLKSEEELRVYLKSHPNLDFFLIPDPYMFVREIQGEDVSTFDPQGEQIRCGVVRYDSGSGKVVTRDKMKVTYNDKAMSGDGSFLQMTRQLEEVLGERARWVMVTWDQFKDEKAHTIYMLKVSDVTGEETLSFTPEDMQSPTNIRIRLFRFWGDVLKKRSDAQHRKVQQLVSGQIESGD
jgi:hypothetical protein